MSTKPPAGVALLWSTLFSSFPREVGNPKRVVVRSLDELIKFYEENNGRNPIYVSVYPYVENPSGGVQVDRIFIDFDAPSLDQLPSVYEEVKKFCTALKEKNIPFLSLFSGKKGFHVYIFFEPVTLTNPKETLKRVVKQLCKWAGVEGKFIDWNVVGDIRRLARLPYSQHPETGLVCYPVDLSSSTLEEIIKAAESPPLLRFQLTRSREIAVLVSFIDFIVSLKEEKTERQTSKPAAATKQISYMRLPCIMSLLVNKLPPGGRWTKAAKFLAIAYYFDHDGSMEGFDRVAEVFVQRQTVGHRMRLSEVKGWARGVYKLNDGRGPTWNCDEIREYLREALLPIPCAKCKLKRLQELENAIQLKANAVAIARQEDLLNRVKKVLDYYVVGEDENKLLLFLLLLESQNIVIKGPPASGKNTLVDAVIKLFPPEEILVVSGATPKFLRWLGKDRIGILYLKEAPKSIFAELKEEGLAMDVKLAMSDKKLILYMVDPRTKETIRREITIDSVVTTTTEVDLPEDVESRVWILSPDISPKQTEAVIEWKAQQYLMTDSPPEEEVKRLRPIIASLRSSTRIIVPYAMAMVSMFKPFIHLPKVRRDVDKIFLLVGAIAKIRGRFYRLNNETVIIPTPQDLETAIQLGKQTIVSMLSGYDPFTVSIYRAFRALEAKYSALTPQIVSSALNIPQTLAQKYLRHLVSSGLAIYDESSRSYSLRPLEEKTVTVDWEKVEQEYRTFMDIFKPEPL